MPTTRTIAVPGIGATSVTFTEAGTGRPVLLLHGGGGPLTVGGFATALADSPRAEARVVTPVHPGFADTPRPETLVDIRGLAATYVALLDDLDLRDVTVVGNSIGGWIAAEMALIGSHRVSGFILVDAVGIQVEGHPVADFFSLTLPQVADLSYHEPDKFRIDPSALSAEQQTALAGNRAALELYAGRSMTDPTLRGRLGAVDAPALVVWGEADRIADPDYGRAYADAIPGAGFHLMTETGHLPQVETPERLVELVCDFVEAHPRATT